MENKNREKEPIPASFQTAAEAGEFWDNHSLADYEEFLEPVTENINIQERIFEVRVAEDIYKKLKSEAGELGQPIPIFIDQLLRKSLVVR